MPGAVPWNSRTARGCGVLVLAIAIGLFWRSLPTALLHDLMQSDVAAAEKIARVKTYFISLGPVAPLIYLLFVTVEVVIAPLPGTLLYAPGGMVFGGFWGGLLSLAGNVIGAVLACQVARVFREALRDRFSQKQALVDLESRIARRGVLIIFLLRVNPLTSSDLVSYAAGLTAMPTWKLAAGTVLGMAPLCWLQAYAADQMLTSFPSLLYPTLLACGSYALVCLAILWRLARKTAAS